MQPLRLLDQGQRGKALPFSLQQSDLVGVIVPDSCVEISAAQWSAFTQASLLHAGWPCANGECGSCAPGAGRDGTAKIDAS